VRHLGHIVNSNLCDNQDCNIKKGVFNSAVNKLAGSYGKLYSPNLMYLFRTFCCSFYGSQLWDFKSRGFSSCCVQWNKAVRKLLQLPFCTHTWLLGPLSGQSHISDQFYIKTFKFLHSMYHHVNPVVSFLARAASSCARSPLGHNISYLRYHCNINMDESVALNVKRIYCNNLLTHEKVALLNVYKELVSHTVCGFTSDMLNHITNDICTE